jgi:pectate lyase
MTVSSFFPPATKTISTCCKIAVGVYLLMAVFSSHAASLVEDAITNAAAGSNLGSTAPWGNSAGQIKVAAGNLAFTGLQSPTNTGNLANLLGTSGGSSYRTFAGSAISAGSIYYSFLIQCAGAPGSGGYLTGLLPGTSPGGSTDALAVYFSASGNGYQLGIHKDNGAPTTNAATVLVTNVTQFIVVKYTFGTGTGDDTVSLYVNPVPGAAEPVPDASQAGGTDATGLQYIYLKSSSGYGVWNFDTLRVGTAWADVTPTSGQVVFAPVPVITQALLVPQGLILRGINGTIGGGPYQVLASTNLSLPASNWPSIASHSFDSVGNFDSTNPVTTGLARQFFRLLVGTNSSASSTAPSITNQPQSLAVSVGATANFLVGASGTAPLNYFWSFNTNTSVGGNNSTLALVNVQAGDAGSYRVIVSNSVGTATSSVATLTVLTPPAITASPTNLNVVSGGSAAFNVTATGSATLQYQWYFNTNTALVNATNATLTLNPISSANAGTYSVIVTNLVGAATSSVAVLTVSGPPVITAQPQSQSVAVSNNATFTVTAAGTAPLGYRWFFNTNTSVGGNSNVFTRLNAQSTNAGTYSVIITNNYGAVTSAFATLTVSTGAVSFAQFNLVGFGDAATGGGEISDTDPAYAKVTNALQLANAVLSFNKTGGIKVIEIMNDLDLGWNEIGTDVQTLASTPFTEHNAPKLHPRLLVTGVSKMNINYKNGGLTIFSANGATIRHCTFNIKSTHNVIVRNLKFDEMWEWDEASKGQYDDNDWDFIDLANGGDVYDIWIDHCTFTKAYDGIVDFKAGSTNVTLSWCKYTGDDGATNPNSFVWQQINALEANKNSYAFYGFLRNNGFSTTNIVQIIQGHDKTHLMGSNDKDPNNVNLSATFHHLWMKNVWDRAVPRLRAGNVHDFNIYVDDTDALAAKRLRNARQLAMSSSSSNTLQNTYSFNPPLNGSISTEGGAVLVEKSVYIDCLYPLRNNQTDPSDPTYTGKILGLDMIYQMDSTVVRGNSTDSGSPLGPFQAPIIPFSWNPASSAPGGVLPYTYTMDDPSQLQSIVTSPTSGAGAGVLTWAKTNWLKTAY